MTVKTLVESMIDHFLEAEMDIEGTLNDIKKELESKHGFEVAMRKSTLGGGAPSYFLKVFGPKSTWTNNIALNSPIHMQIMISDGKIEMNNNSYQIHKAKAKMRAARFTTEADLKKKLMAYFSKNASKFKEILGESLEEARDDYGFNINAKSKGKYTDYKVMHDGKHLMTVNARDEDEAFKIVDGQLKHLRRSIGKATPAVKTLNVKKWSGHLPEFDDIKLIKESLNESDYQVMHKTFTSAVDAAKKKAEKAGYTIDDDEWFRKVSSGPRKPSRDKTNRYNIELLTKKGNDAKKALSFQVYNTGNAYELNAYIN